jgi:hypothetical protein
MVLLLLTAGIFGRPSSAQSQQFGLEWQGDGSVRRMLYWSNPFPIYPATYLFKVYPRAKLVPGGCTHGVAPSSPTGYYTLFFWGNNGQFAWRGGNADTYYGMHPYPMPNNLGCGQWEISVASADLVTGVEVTWNRWYQQAIRVWRDGSGNYHHEFYYDWDPANPPTSCAAPRCESQDVGSGWATSNPPNPAIVIGQAPDLCGPPPCSTGQSWGGYPGWEEWNGIVRGIQLYSGLLSLTDIQAEITTPKSSAAGQSLIWYLNLDPRPSDVTDKKGVGTPNNPAWAGTTAKQWSSAASPPPSPPLGLRVQ